jgi:hypothetical protein
MRYGESVPVFHNDDEAQLSQGVESRHSPAEKSTAKPEVLLKSAGEVLLKGTTATTEAARPDGPGQLNEIGLDKLRQTIDQAEDDRTRPELVGLEHELRPERAGATQTVHYQDAKRTVTSSQTVASIPEPRQYPVDDTPQPHSLRQSSSTQSTHQTKSAPTPQQLVIAGVIFGALIALAVLLFVVFIGL